MRDAEILGVVAMLLVYEVTVRAWVVAAIGAWRARRNAVRTIEAIASRIAEQGPRVAQHQRLIRTVQSMVHLETAGDLQVQVMIHGTPEVQRFGADLPLAIVLVFARTLVRNGTYTPDEVETAVAAAIDCVGVESGSP